MVEDRLGGKLSEAKGNPWQKIHAPLMEYEELMLERQGQTGRIRPYGFVRLAYRDDVDGSPQFCRAYLPPGYEPGKKWPLVMQLHGYNPANPVYVRWWGASDRHPGIDTEFSNHQGVIYLEAHGRGNTQYLGMGDSDVLHAIAEAKRLFSVDDDRVYLTGDSMGGWGTWNVATRHPDLFAAIAPVFGGVDYHSTMSEEDLARLIPIDRFFNEKQSSLGDGRRAPERADLRPPRRRGPGRERGVLALGRSALTALGLRRPLPRVPRTHPRGPGEPATPT